MTEPEIAVGQRWRNDAWRYHVEVAAVNAIYARVRSENSGPFWIVKSDLRRRYTLVGPEQPESDR